MTDGGLRDQWRIRDERRQALCQSLEPGCGNMSRVGITLDVRSRYIYNDRWWKSSEMFKRQTKSNFRLSSLDQRTWDVQDDTNFAQELSNLFVIFMLLKSPVHVVNAEAKKSTRQPCACDSSCAVIKRNPIGMPHSHSVILLHHSLLIRSEASLIIKFIFIACNELSRKRFSRTAI